ncbi:hypothetical protein LI90_1099 [Carbonactinospora thermoautotrophica]|uniref:Uncharacterized protein n=1 Tax=Carbonactinospora thermoautotrophica TaxID=1469144 RepID=A0A132MNM2_9ACTN|nr:hypothetical protein LI90_1099 [Carbonactinospora thermoautotrophica]
MILGTNSPSITSHWIRSTPACSSARHSSPNREKSAGKTDGTIRGRGADGCIQDLLCLHPRNTVGPATVPPTPPPVGTTGGTAPPPFLAEKIKSLVMLPTWQTDRCGSYSSTTTRWCSRGSKRC